MKRDAKQTRLVRVFVLEPTDQPTHLAQRFGNLTYVFEEFEERSSIWDTEQLTKEILQQLREDSFDPMKDYVVVTGKNVPLAVYLAAVAAEYGAFQALLYDAKDRQYCERVLGCTI